MILLGGGGACVCELYVLRPRRCVCVCVKPACVLEGGECVCVCVKG